MEELQEGEEKYRCLPNVLHRIREQAMLTDNFWDLRMWWWWMTSSRMINSRRRWTSCVRFCISSWSSSLGDRGADARKRVEWAWCFDASVPPEWLDDVPLVVKIQTLKGWLIAHKFNTGWSVGMWKSVIRKEERCWLLWSQVQGRNVLLESKTKQGRLLD